MQVFSPRGKRERAKFRYAESEVAHKCAVMLTSSVKLFTAFTVKFAFGELRCPAEQHNSAFRIDNNGVSRYIMSPQAIHHARKARSMPPTPSVAFDFPQTKRYL